MKKNYLKVFFLLIMIVTIVGCSNNKTNVDDKLDSDIKIVVYDKDNTVVYNEEKTTSKKYLLDALKTFDDLKLETETGDYGEYIISINGKKQEDNHYWNYYINDEYASVGVSSYEIKENDIYTFKLEKFE